MKTVKVSPLRQAVNEIVAEIFTSGGGSRTKAERLALMFKGWDERPLADYIVERLDQHGVTITRDKMKARKVK